MAVPTVDVRLTRAPWEHHGRRVVRWSWLVVLLFLLALSAWAVVEARQAMLDGKSAQRSLEQSGRALQDGDLVLANDLARDASTELAAARGSAESVPLRLASRLPILGDDVRALRSLTGALNEVVADAVVPLTQSAVDVLEAQEAAPDGVIAVDALRSAGTTAQQADEVTGRALEIADRVDSVELIPPLRAPVREAAEALRELDDRVGTVEQSISAGVFALGGDGPRTYLLAAQNLAEARPTGGLIGSWALISADQGVIRLEETGVNDDLAALVGGLPDLPDDVEAMYGQSLALSQNVNLSPDFPLGAQLLGGLWTAQGRPAPDGVIGVDPVGLARLLGSTGPVEARGGPTLDRQNLVRVVQQEVYRTFDGRTAERQAYLGNVMGAVFDALVRSDWTSPDLRRAIGSSVTDRHIQMWSADEGTQELLVELGAAGELPEPDADEPTVRLHLTNADGSKLDQFLDVSVSTECTDASPQLVARLTNDPPERLPRYSQSHLDDLDPYDHRLMVALYLPPTRGLDGLSVAGAPKAVASGNERGWTVVRTTVDLAAGTTSEMRWTLSGRDDRPLLVTQPLTREADVQQPPPGRRTCGS